MGNSVETCDKETDNNPIFRKPEKTAETPDTPETPETVKEKRSAAIRAALGSAFGDLSLLSNGK